MTDKAYHLKKNFPSHDEAIQYIIELHAMLEECADYFDNHSDIIDGENGPLPNQEMRLLSDIQNIL